MSCEFVSIRTAKHVLYVTEGSNCLTAWGGLTSCPKIDAAPRLSAFDLQYCNTVDGRNPEPPGIYNTHANREINYLLVQSFWTISNMKGISMDKSQPFSDGKVLHWLNGIGSLRFLRKGPDIANINSWEIRIWHPTCTLESSKVDKYISGSLCVCVYTYIYIYCITIYIYNRYTLHTDYCSWWNFKDIFFNIYPYLGELIQIWWLQYIPRHPVIPPEVWCFSYVFLGPVIPNLSFGGPGCLGYYSNGWWRTSNQYYFTCFYFSLGFSHNPWKWIFWCPSKMSFLFLNWGTTSEN